MRKVFCRLRVLMAEADPPLNQADLIRQTGLSSHTVSRLYNNNAIRLDIPTLETLMEFFNCDLDRLITTRVVEEVSGDG